MARDSFRGKTVCVTGAASGLGAALVDELARQGARPLLVDLDAAGLAARAADLARRGVAAPTLVVDVSAAEAPAQVLGLARAHGSGLDGLINAAGVLVAGPLDTLDPAHASRLLDVNLKATVLLTRACLPLLRARPGSFVCNVSSVSWLLASAHNGLYDASKAGLYAFSRALRRELAGSGVRVSVLLPALVRTPMLDDAALLTALGLDRRTVGRLAAAQPEDVARAALRGIAAGRFAILPDPAARVLWWLHRLGPELPRALGERLRRAEPAAGLRALGHAYRCLHRVPALGDALVRGSSRGLGRVLARLPAARRARGDLAALATALDRVTALAGSEVEVQAASPASVEIEVHRCPYGFAGTAAAAVCDAAMDMDRTLFARCGARLLIHRRLVDGAPSCLLTLTAVDSVAGPCS